MTIINPPNSQRCHKFRLRTTLVVPFVLQIVAGIGLVGYLSFRNGQQAVFDLASQLSNQVNERVIGQLNDYLSTPKQINKVNLKALRLDMLQPQDLDQTRRFFWEQMRVFENLSYVNFGNQEGLFIGVGREDDGSLYVEQIQPTDDFTYQSYALDHQGDLGEFLRSEFYPFQEDEWYSSAVAAGQPAWSSIYQWEDRPEITSISINYPIYNGSQQLIGVLGADFILSQISDFLQSLNVSPSGQVVVIEQDGQVVASSNINTLYQEVDGQFQRVNILAGNDLLLRDAAQQLHDRFGGFEQISETAILSMNLNQQPAFVSVTPWQDDLGLNWLIIVAIPESDFMAKINANNRRTIWLTLAALGLAIGIGILTARAISHPILDISAATGAMAKGNLDQHVKEESNIVEVRTLAHSFNSMAEQLKDSFNTLEHKNEALRIAEENFRSIFENALEGIFQSSPEGRFLNVNPALAQIYGYVSPQEMIEQITDIATQLYVDPERRTEFRDLLEQQGVAKDFEYRCYRKDGSIIWTQIDARSVKDKNGDLLYYEGIVQDITARKQQEASWKRQFEELQVEIDHKQRARQVAEITSTDYFQQLMAEADDLRNFDDEWS